MAAEARRPHTGRRRNDAAREAILDAALRLLAAGTGHSSMTVDAIAAAAGVGKQTIYRWWPSKTAVLLDAVTERAADSVSVPDTGALAEDLRAFLTATFQVVRAPDIAAALRRLMVEAQSDALAAEWMNEFLKRRRHALRQIFLRARARDEVRAGADIGLLVDQAFGTLWYRLLTGIGSLDSESAAGLASGLACQAGLGTAPTDSS